MAELDEERRAREALLTIELQKQSDRGVAIIGAAWVEEELAAAVDHVLLDDRKARDRLFRKAGPLSSFSAKIDLGRLLGILSEGFTADLHRVRDIRNDFAHSISEPSGAVLTFESHHIRDRCRAFRRSKYQGPDARGAFIAACIFLTNDLWVFRQFAPKTTPGTFGQCDETGRWQ